MNPQTIKQAIEYAKADPESQFATELRKRIESGSLDNELHNAGLSEFATKTQGNNLAGGFLRSVTAPALRAGQLVGKEVAGFIGGEDARQRAEQAIQQPTTIPGLGRGTTFPGLKPEGQGRGKQLAGETLESAVSFAPYGRIAGALSKAGLSKAGANILTGLVGGYTADVAMNMQQDKTLGQTLTPGIGTAIGGAIPAIPVLVRAGKAIVAPKKTVEKAVGEILQGKPEDVSRGIKALKEIDLKNINTFSELSTKFDEKIKELSSVVDNELAKDTTRYGFDDFLVTQSTKGGQEVNTNFVVRALQDLQELYTSIGDDVSRAEIDEFVERVSKDGVTKKEINDLARLYGEEFSSKAFSKTGDPLTSVNAQRFENTRSGLKTTARLSIGGKEAKLADEKMSAIFRAKELSDKMVNKVNELKQKVNERGLLEQIGRGAVKFIDTITGGTVRGAVGGLLPRGVGNKVMNALDIEEALRKNLDVIDNALNATDDSGIIKALKNLKFPGDIIDEQTNIINKTKEFIDNPKLGLSIEDVSKKAGSVSDDLMKEARKYNTLEEFVKATQVKDSQYYTEQINRIKSQPKTFGIDNKPVIDVLKKSLENVKQSELQKIKEITQSPVLSETQIKAIKEATTFDELWNVIKNEKQDFMGMWTTRLQNVFPKNVNRMTKSQLTEIWKKANEGEAMFQRTDNITDDLIQEAKKYNIGDEISIIDEAKNYKTPEAFIDAKNKQYVYHTTTDAGVEGIIENGLTKDLAEIYPHGQKLEDSIKKMVYFADTPEATQNAGTFKTGNIIRIKKTALDISKMIDRKMHGRVETRYWGKDISPVDIEIKTNDGWQNILDYAEDYYPDIIETMKKNNLSWNKGGSPVVTKSQLEEIWKKANQN